MKDQFLKVACRRHFFDKHQRVLIAVSGGLDSMSLLELLKDSRELLGIDIGLAHVHHGQRPEADQEAAYLKAYADREGLPFYLDYFTGVFTEEGARQFRYQFFEQVMRAEQYTALVTAHHADDQAETILMRLIRGSRLLHLSAIRECQPFGPGELIRPLLSFSKSDLPSVFHFQDASNASPAFLRNRVRHRYLPQLEEENPKIRQHLRQLGDDISAATAALDFFIEGTDYRSLAIFRSYPEAVQACFLQDYLRQIPDLQVSRAQFQEILDLIRRKTNQDFPIKSGYRLVMDYDRFVIRKIQPETDGHPSEILLKSGDLAEFSGYQAGFNVCLPEADQIIRLPSADPVTLRHRREGDVLLYRGHHKKLRRLFIEKKISRQARQSAVIVEQSGKIISILGIAASDLSKSLKSDTIGNTLYLTNIKREK